MEIILKDLPAKEQARLNYYIKNGRLTTYYNSNGKKCYNSTGFENLQKKVRAKKIIRNYKQVLDVDDSNIKKTLFKDLTKSQLHTIIYYNNLLREKGVIFYIEKSGNISVGIEECLEIINEYKNRNKKTAEEVRVYNKLKQREHREKLKQIKGDKSCV